MDLEKMGVPKGLDSGTAVNNAYICVHDRGVADE